MAVRTKMISDAHSLAVKYGGTSFELTPETSLALSGPSDPEGEAARKRAWQRHIAGEEALKSAEIIVQHASVDAGRDQQAAVAEVPLEFTHGQ